MTPLQQAAQGKVMTRTLITQMLEAMEDAQKYAHNVGKYLHGVPQAIQAARKYLTADSSGERAELIARKNIASNLRYLRYPDCHAAADMLEADAQRITELEALSVTNIMLDVVPGDGSGFEVFAKSTSDVVDLLTKMSEKIDDLIEKNQRLLIERPQSQIGSMSAMWTAALSAQGEKP